jgi:hypothetical protein
MRPVCHHNLALTIIPRGTPQTMEASAGTRTMHVFGATRAWRRHETTTGCTQPATKVVYEAP